jgi:hypothetical protein
LRVESIFSGKNTMAEDNLGSLEADALKRKERLLALKRKRDESSGNAEHEEPEIKEELPK